MQAFDSEKSPLKYLRDGYGNAITSGAWNQQDMAVSWNFAAGTFLSVRIEHLLSHGRVALSHFDHSMSNHKLAGMGENAPNLRQAEREHDRFASGKFLDHRTIIRARHRDRHLA